MLPRGGVVAINRLAQYKGPHTAEPCERGLELSWRHKLKGTGTKVGLAVNRLRRPHGRFHIA